MTRRALLPHRDTMRTALLLSAAKVIGALVITAVILAPDLIVSLAGAR